MANSIIVNSMGIGGGIFAGLVIFWFISVYLKKRVASDPSNHAAANAPRINYSEKRRHPRADVAWAATLKTTNGDFEAALRDISLGGAFVVCQNPLPLSQKFQIDIDLAGRDTLLLNAEVVWSNINVPNDKVVNRGMGIRFIDNPAEIRSDLNALIVEALAETSGTA